ncbi:MAG: TatD family hydrolase [Bradymonadia bacterium]
MSTTEGAIEGSIPLIDSHAHLDFDRFDADREAVLDRAWSAGVQAILTIGTDVATSAAALALAEGHDRLFASAGIHPHEAGAFEDAHWPRLEQMWAHDHIKAVGETGLDYYYDYSPRARQQQLFRRHLEISGEVGLPVVIHIRDAFDDAFEILAEVGTPAGGVVHCFTGGPRECERALSLDLHVSISGVVTFKNARDLQAAVPLIPEDKLLVETDAPFLAPTPNRGKRNEPSFVVHTAAKVAELRGVSYADLCASTMANTIKLFDLPDLTR